MSDSALVAGLRAAKATLPQLVALAAARRNRAVQAMATALRRHDQRLHEANLVDLDGGIATGLSGALLDRLTLDAPRRAALAAALDAVAALPDPLDDSSAPEVARNGLRLRQKPAPLGVVAMIYESRPNVTAEAAALCFKAGNACVLRGGREARHSNLALAGILRDALADEGIDPNCLLLLDDPDRSQMAELLTRDDLVDLVIPRGGEALIRHVVATSRIPVIRHYKGVCHLYVDASADLDMALRLLLDGKASRPGVCNALECLLIHRSVAAAFLPAAAHALLQRGVEVRACSESRELLPGLLEATADDWGQEFLAPILAIRIVDDIDVALAHIRRYGSNHTEVICSRDAGACARFVNEVDASAVAVNASSRFNDGGELGLGAEIGISTTKLHAYGPMGLASLTTRKWVIEGDGQIRHPDLQINHAKPGAARERQ